MRCVGEVRGRSREVAKRSAGYRRSRAFGPGRLRNGLGVLWACRGKVPPLVVPVKQIPLLIVLPLELLQAKGLALPPATGPHPFQCRVPDSPATRRSDGAICEEALCKCGQRGPKARRPARLSGSVPFEVAGVGAHSPARGRSTARQPHAARCGRLDPTRGEDLRVFWGSLQLAGAADGLFLAGTDGLFRR